MIRDVNIQTKRVIIEKLEKPFLVYFSADYTWGDEDEEGGTPREIELVRYPNEQDYIEWDSFNLFPQSKFYTVISESGAAIGTLSRVCCKRILKND